MRYQKYEATVRASSRGNVLTVRLFGELDYRYAPDAEEKIRGLVVKTPLAERYLILDLSKVTFVDSAGMQLVLLIHMSFRGCVKGFGVILCDSPKKVFRECALDNMFVKGDTAEEVMAILNGVAQNASDPKTNRLAVHTA